MGRVYFRKRKNYRLLKFLFVFCFFVFFIIGIFNYIDRRISPKLMDYAELEIRRQSNIIITQSMSTDDFDSDDFYVISKNDSNEILSVDFNTVLLNKLIMHSTLKIQESLKNLELGIIDDGIVLSIPLGLVYNNFLFNNFGPRIPVKLKILGDMESSVTTNVKNYGINSALVEISIVLTVMEKVILPISTREIVVTQSIPIVIKLVEGKVPNYYSNGINKTESFSIPIE